MFPWNRGIEVQNVTNSEEFQTLLGRANRETLICLRLCGHKGLRNCGYLIG